MDVGRLEGYGKESEERFLAALEMTDRGAWLEEVARAGPTPKFLRGLVTRHYSEMSKSRLRSGA